MKLRNGLMCVTAVAALSFALSGCAQSQTPAPSGTKNAGNQTSAEAQKENAAPVSELSGTLDFAIGNSGSTQEIVGAQMIELFKKAMPSMQISSVATSGSAANCGLLIEDGCDMAIVTAESAYQAQQGLGAYEEPTEDLRAICTLIPNTYQIWANKDAGIQDFGDIASKKVCFGTPGSGPYQPTLDMMEVFGITEESVKAAGGEIVSVAWGDAVDMLSDGNIDVLIWTTSFPASAVVNAQAGGKEFDFVQISPDMIKKFEEAHPGWIDITVPAGTYSGQTEDVICPATYQGVYVKGNMSDELAYAITETVCSNYEAMSKVHALMADFGDETVATGTGIELHPGAQKYYEEHNIPFSN